MRHMPTSLRSYKLGVATRETHRLPRHRYGLLVQPATELPIKSLIISLYLSGITLSPLIHYPRMLPKAGHCKPCAHLRRLALLACRAIPAVSVQYPHEGDNWNFNHVTSCNSQSRQFIITSSSIGSVQCSKSHSYGN